MSKKHFLKTAVTALAAIMCLNTSVSTAFAVRTPTLPKFNGVTPHNVGEMPKRTDLKYESVPVEKFRVSNLSPKSDTDLDYTDWWYSEWEDCRFIFLPATADRKKLVIEYDSKEPIYLNDKKLTSGETVDILASGDEFTVKAGDTDCGKLRIMQSELGCFYLFTTHNGLNALDGNRWLQEKGTALMLNSDGSTVYSGDIEKFEAHGNSTWDYSKKKPYHFKLAKKADLYGMGKAKKWVLLANYLDHSMLRNKLTEEMCHAADMEYAVDSVFVDLYADGSYRGTYQLSEKVEVKKNRVNISDLEEETEKVNEGVNLKETPRVVVGAEDVMEYMENSYKYHDIPNDPADITGGYLLQRQQFNRYGYKAESGFVTSRGQAISLETPEYASKAQMEYIRNFVQDAEDAIYSENGYNSKGKHYSDYIDIDSFIKAYLVQEITMNIDGTFSSYFMWKDSDLTGDGKLHFGPSWDFDLSYGDFPTGRTNSDGNGGFSTVYNNLFTAYFPIHGYDFGPDTGSTRPVCGISWEGQLYKQPEFLRRIATTYMNDFEPFLTKYTDGDSPLLTKMAEDMQRSANMNNARWHTYGGSDYAVFGMGSGDDFFGSVEILRDFAQKRKNWLTELWKPESYIKGDVNSDGVLSVADLTIMKKWLLSGGDMKDWTAGDLCADNRIDVYDLCELRHRLLMTE
ncbi:CotH kinase family protein [Ruminococcus sp.]|uniref:CotH kinase family protein n=1 Tax=Ruminococcus sp. TaxID=41978 RepID=UPI0025CEEF9E|nr:CotH kinase family protein [Ruminococcus sp.]